MTSIVKSKSDLLQIVTIISVALMNNKKLVFTLLLVAVGFVAFVTTTFVVAAQKLTYVVYRVDKNGNRIEYGNAKLDAVIRGDCSFVDVEVEE